MIHHQNKPHVDLRTATLRVSSHEFQIPDGCTVESDPKFFGRSVVVDPAGTITHEIFSIDAAIELGYNTAFVRPATTHREFKPVSKGAILAPWQTAKAS